MVVPVTAPNAPPTRDPLPPPPLANAARAMGVTRAGEPHMRAPAADAPPFWGEDGFTFDDLIDVINPLQHIPLVNIAYRELTGDQIAYGPRVLGAGLFNITPVGAAVSVVTAMADIAIEQRTGRSVGEHVVAALFGDDADTGTMVAEAAPQAFEAAEAPKAVDEAQDAEAAMVMADETAMLAAIAPAAGGAAPMPTAEPVMVPPPPPPPPPASNPPPATPPVSLTSEQWLNLVSMAGAPDAPASVQPPDMAATMSDALDKYGALMRARNALTDSGAR